MFALGTANCLGSFVGSMPVVASLGRCAVNAASGARTPFGGIVTGILVLMACAFLTPHFAYIPTSALSAVIIAAMIFTVDIDILLPMWRSQSKMQNHDLMHDLHGHSFPPFQSWTLFRTPSPSAWVF